MHKRHLRAFKLYTGVISLLLPKHPFSPLLAFRMDDGRLLDYLMNHDELMEEKVAFYIRDITEALQYLHNCRVAHLDIKVMQNQHLCQQTVA